MTLGQVKDRFNDVLNVESAKASLLDERTEQQNEVLVARQELQNVIAMLGDSLSPELLQHARQQQNVMISQEAAKIIDVLPQWKDQAVFQADRTKINALLTNYGFSSAELSNLYDHRLIKLAFDAMGWKGRIDKAHENVQPVRNAPGKPGKQINQNRSNAQKRAHTLKRAREGGRNDVIAGVHALLNP